MERISEFLKLLADPSRMKIFKFLQSGEVYVCELSEALQISQPTVSQHIRRFKFLNLVREERQGQKVCYTLNQEEYQQLSIDLSAIMNTKLPELDMFGSEWQRWVQYRRDCGLPCEENCIKE